MGLFDWVNYSERCSCGQLVGGFQTKDVGQNMQWVEPFEVERFYSVCDSCGKRFEYTHEAKSVLQALLDLAKSDKELISVQIVAAMMRENYPVLYKRLSGVSPWLLKE